MAAAYEEVTLADLRGQISNAEFQKERTKSFAQKHVSVRILGAKDAPDEVPDFECYRCVELGAQQNQMIMTCNYKFNACCKLFPIFKGCDRRFCKYHGHMPCIDAYTDGSKEN